MTREEAKRQAELYSALAEGKTIQFKQENGEWTDLKTDLMCGIAESFRYRIKPELKYRPFNNQEECFNELQNHEPYGILKNKESGRTAQIYGLYTEIRGNQLKIAHSDTFGNCCETANFVYYQYEFKDGTPFGIKEE